MDRKVLIKCIMKYLNVILIIVSVSLPNVWSNSVETSKYGETITAHVKGMVCDFCARGLEKVFNSEKAVSKIFVNLDDSIVSIRMKPDKNLPDKRIKEIIMKNGYSVEKMTRSEAKSETKN